MKITSLALTLLTFISASATEQAGANENCARLMVTDGMAVSAVDVPTAGAGSESDARLQTARLDAAQIEAAIKELAQAKIDLEDARITGSMPQINLMALQKDISKKEKEIILILGLKDYEHKINILTAALVIDNNKDILAYANAFEVRKLYEFNKLSGYTKIQTFSALNNVASVTKFSPNGKMFVSVNNQKEIVVYDSQNGSELNRFTFHESICPSLQFSPDGKYIYAAFDGSKLYVFDLIKNKFDKHIETPNSKTKFEFHPDGQHILVAEHGGFSIYNRHTGKFIKRIKNLSGSRKIQFSPDGKFLAVGLQNGVIDIYTTDNYELITKINETQELGLDTTRFEITSVGKNIHILAPRFMSSPTNILAYSFSIHSEGYVKAYYSQTAQGSDSETLIMASAISPDNKYFITGLDDNKSIEIFDIELGRTIQVIELPLQANDFAKSVKYNAAGTHVIVITDIGNAFVVDLKQSTTKIIQASPSTIRNAEFNSDGSRILLNVFDSSRIRDWQIQLWRPQTVDEFSEAVAP
jgi:WD40 repeat protein